MALTLVGIDVHFLRHQSPSAAVKENSGGGGGGKYEYEAIAIALSL